MTNMSELIEWHRADEVLPDVNETVIALCPGEVDLWVGFFDGEWWRMANGDLLGDVLYWALPPEGPEQ